MKINLDVQLLCVPPDEMRGIPTYILNLIRCLVMQSKNDYSAFFADESKRGDLKHLLKQNIGETTFNNLNINECSSFNWNSLEYSIYYNVSNLQSIKKYLEFISTGYDLVHFPYSLFIPENINIPNITTVLDLIPLVNPVRLLLSKIHITLFKNSLKNVVNNNLTSIISISEATKRDILKLTSMPKERIHVIPCGYDKSIHFPEQNESVLNNLGITKPYLLYLAALDPHKGIINIINAFDIIKKKNKDIKLVLTGKSSNLIYREIIDSCIKSSANSKHIIRTGFIDDDQKRALMSGSEIFLFPSEYEGFGLPVLEAMACGAPVITSNISSLPEVGGDAAVYVTPNQPQMLANEIERFLNSKDLRDEYSSKSLEQAAKFSWDKTAEMTEEVYHIAHKRCNNIKNIKINDTPSVITDCYIPDTFSKEVPVVFYGAGRNSRKEYIRLTEQGFSVLCFADADSSKWGKSAYPGCPANVYSIDEIILNHDYFYVYITITVVNKYIIQDFLINEKKIPKNRIIGYKSDIKRKSCVFLETSIVLYNECELCICRSEELNDKSKMPVLKCSDDIYESIDRFIEMRNGIIEDIKNNSKKYPCINCAMLKEQMWSADYQVLDFIISYDKDFKHSTDIMFDKRVDILLELEKRGYVDSVFTKISFSDIDLQNDPKSENLLALAKRYYSP